MIDSFYIFSRYCLTIIAIIFIAKVYFNPLLNRQNKLVKPIIISIILDIIIFIYSLFIHFGILNSENPYKFLIFFYYAINITAYLYCFYLLSNQKKFYVYFTILALGVVVTSYTVQYLFKVRIAQPFFYSLLLIASLFYLVFSVKGLKFDSKLNVAGFWFSLAIITPVILSLPFSSISFYAKNLKADFILYIKLPLNFLGIIFMYYCFYKSIKLSTDA